MLTDIWFDENITIFKLVTFQYLMQLGKIDNALKNCAQVNLVYLL